MTELRTFSEMADTLENLPLILREIRRARGLSGREVGRLTGISNATLSQFENGRARLSYDHAIRVLRFIDQTTGDRS